MPSRRAGEQRVGGLAAALVALVFACPASAQTTQENLDKYWFLRTRLATEFVHVGDQQGDSLVAHVREEGEQYIRWADTTVHHGWYLGVLATERFLLASTASYPGYANGQSGALAAVESELHYALAALERLDLVADAAFPPPCTAQQQLNGFFIRDDVPADFHQHFTGVTSARSDFTDAGIYLKEMSQDQAYHVIFGLALVKALVPSSVEVSGQGLREWAVTQAVRIGTHMAADGWRIRNPACDKLVARGDDARVMSQGTSLAVSFISDGATNLPWDLLATAAWGTLSDPGNLAYLNSDNMHMAMALAATGNGWGAGTLDALMNLATIHGWYAYPLLNVVLAGASPPASWPTHAAAAGAATRNMLDELPSGAETASPRPQGPNPHGWSTSNRFVRASDNHYTGTDGSDFERYDGLDYLLLHNLYAIALPASWELGAGG
ncbi:MAG: hypothetical protein JRI23_06625, partial [Deltaproteobacteria bacterium]|nr:hypothetical protein [Deltaproteobacteria bacterium]MBW2531262.1 hypothetical protein [Deltaproteobacteria bacterium]